VGWNAGVGGDVTVHANAHVNTETNTSICVSADGSPTLTNPIFILMGISTPLLVSVPISLQARVPVWMRTWSQLFKKMPLSMPPRIKKIMLMLM
jgi:hypothetical protein